MSVPNYLGAAAVLPACPHPDSYPPACPSVRPSATNNAIDNSRYNFIASDTGFPFTPPPRSFPPLISHSTSSPLHLYFNLPLPPFPHSSSSSFSIISLILFLIFLTITLVS